MDGVFHSRPSFNNIITSKVSLLAAFAGRPRFLAAGLLFSAFFGRPRPFDSLAGALNTNRFETLSANVLPHSL